MSRVAPSPTPRCSSYRKGSLWVILTYCRQLYLLFFSKCTWLQLHNHTYYCLKMHMKMNRLSSFNNGKVDEIWHVLIHFITTELELINPFTGFRAIFIYFSFYGLLAHILWHLQLILVINNKIKHTLFVELAKSQIMFWDSINFGTSTNFSVTPENIVGERWMT